VIIFESLLTTLNETVNMLGSWLVDILLERKTKPSLANLIIRQRVLILI